MSNFYAEALELARTERQLERCCAIDREYPSTEQDGDVMIDHACRCVQSETEIDSALAETLATVGR